MAYTYRELKEKTLADLKKIAKEIDHEAVKGYSQLNKDHLLEAICKALNIQMHEHHEVKGLDKAAVKKEIKELKKKRDKVLEAHDHKKLKEVRQKIKKLKKTLRKATV
ncbi:MAG: Rho termination factor N-terminal domain-containing protein [bacterium]